jgi:hypothetical protein
MDFATPGKPMPVDQEWNLRSEKLFLVTLNNSTLRKYDGF